MIQSFLLCLVTAFLTPYNLVLHAAPSSVLCRPSSRPMHCSYSCSLRVLQLTQVVFSSSGIAVGLDFAVALDL